MMEVSGDIEVAISAWKRLVEDRESTIERLRAEVAALKEINGKIMVAKDETCADFWKVFERAKFAEKVIAGANNSLFGSHGFFVGDDGVHHLDKPIEELKSRVGEAESALAALRKRIDEAPTARINEFKILDSYSVFVPAELAGKRVALVVLGEG